MISSTHSDAALRRSFVSVLGQKEFVGAGVLISNSLVLTCAHVVNSALGRHRFEDSVPAQGNVVRLRMPHVSADREFFGRVEQAMWRPPRAHPSPQSGHAETAGKFPFPYFGDLAVLRLAEPPPDGAEPAPFLPERDGYAVIALWASGHPAMTITASPRAAAEPWIVLDVDAGEAREGHSGGPLWDRDREAVVGIVVATHVDAPGKSPVARRPLYAIGLPAIEAELPDLPPVEVPTAGHGRQQTLAALERLLPGTQAVLKCETRLAAKLGRESIHQAADHHRLLTLAVGVRRGVPELLEVVREYLVDTGALGSSDERAAWDRLLRAARVVSPRETLTALQRRELVGLLAQCRETDPEDLLRAVLPYADELPLVSGLMDVTDLLEGYPSDNRLMPPLLQAVVRISLVEHSVGNPLSEELDAWVDRVAPRLGIPEAAVYQFRDDIRPTPCGGPTETATASPRIQVELLPIAPGHRFTYQIWVYSGADRHELVLVQDSEVTSEQVVEGVRAVLRTKVHEHTDQALVEFFLAPPWLRLDVDTWHLRGNEEDGDFYLGITRRVVLRSSGRTRDTYAGWKRRTKALPLSRPIVLDQRSARPGVAQAQLEAVPNAGVVIMCCEQQHQNQVLRQCLQAGVHTVLWHRQEHDSETAKRLLDLVEGISHTKLPETIRLERAKALADPDCPTHHGRRLSLLYDGPDHRPPPFAPDAWALTQP
ncbi:trypsin-like peptidase domain-containing protein [Streptomyces sp. NPDC016566]|uniref:VMAP-C domain-containing protein n=1 Tax=Streptomyces sp. NPDC016566 TaxID=3364967 RepID=UPI0036FE653D